MDPFTMSSMFVYQEPEDQEKLELQDRLFDKVMHIVDHHLTEKQRQVVNLYYFQGKTQYQVADLLGVHQTAIFFGIHGQKHSGGLLRKIRKFISKDPEAVRILEELRD
jgi:predicted DNA-binding protein YlxM (UPF0122 family)